MRAAGSMTEDRRAGVNAGLSKRGRRLPPTAFVVMMSEADWQLMV